MHYLPYGILLMKFSKTILFYSLFFSTSSLIAAPTDFPEHHNLVYTDPIAYDNPCKISVYCESYGAINKPSIYGELAHIDQYKDKEKIDLIAEHTKDLIHNLYLLTKKVENIAVDTADSMEGVETTLNNFASKISNNEVKIQENSENITEMSVYTAEQFSTLSTLTIPSEPQIMPVTLRPMSADNLMYTGNLDLIKHIDQKMNALKTEVASLDKKLNAGLATQAALSGLFQPDEKNKMNLTAALGGYHTNMALAVGMGYRFNQHIATRAGVAFSPNSRLTYNTAINFSW